MLFMTCEHSIACYVAVENVHGNKDKNMKIRCKTTQSIEKFNPDDLNPNTDLFGMFAVVFVFMAVLLSI